MKYAIVAVLAILGCTAGGPTIAIIIGGATAVALIYG